MRDYFCGWYFKFQNRLHTVAIIPAYHIAKGVKSCSIQVIVDNDSWNIPFDYDRFRKNKEGVDIAGNHFGREGIVINLYTPELTVNGALSFGKPTLLRYNIMGPFKYVPFMECQHKVVSMRHAVKGSLTINGMVLEFRDGIGYIEGDKGYSFPKNYLWTQCFFQDGSLMLAVADIPFCGTHFDGIIGAMIWKGKEYRIATYLGAKVLRIRDGEVVIRQGRSVLTVRQLEKNGVPLNAPILGNMSRTIHETASCKVYFHYQENGRTIFEAEISNAAFEYEYPY